MEVCVDSLESAINAFNGGASRLELCSSLNEGGLTPSVGLYKSVRKFLQENAAADSRDDFAVNCMIRCRPGDFFYSESEIDTMVQDLNVFVELQADGLVFGALDAQGNVDQAVMKQVLELVPAASSGIKTTFHRQYKVLCIFIGEFRGTRKNYRFCHPCPSVTYLFLNIFCKENYVFSLHVNITQYK